MGPITQALGNITSGIAQGAAKGAASEGNYKQLDDQATATNAAPESAAIGVDSVQALPQSNQKANIGIDQAARIESEVGAPVGNEIKNTGLQTNQQTSDLINQTKNDYHSAVQGAIQATTNAEEALNKAAENAKIDPQAYLNSMGVGGKLMTSIGMVLSGIGSGVTGQANLAMDAYQKNVDRAIQAQALQFKNMMEVSAQKQGLIKTAQDKQMIAANAYNAAVMSVATGANVAIQGAMTQIKSSTAVPLAAQLQNMNNQLNSQAIDRHSKDFSSVIQSGNVQKTNLMGEIMRPVVDHLSGRPSSPAAKGVSPVDRVGRPGNGVPSSDQQKAETSNNFDRELYEREQKQAAQEQAITGQPPSNSGSYGFLNQYGDKQ